ncbi:Ataxin-3, partial [Chytridiales sp. JEL 0842]
MDLIDAGVIFHERQDGQLCAQHALNSLLQGPYFTAVDLSTIAQDLDQQELNAMAEGGLESDEYQKRLNESSQNYDDSGFFSVQVLSSALQVWNLTLIPIGSRSIPTAKSDPAGQNAFILNLNEHWFTLRRFGGKRGRWYNLNSMKPKPSYVTETYISLLLSQMESDGYSIFAVQGELPECEGD